MKTALRIVLPVCAVALIWVLLKDRARPAGDKVPHPAAASVSAPASQNATAAGSTVPAGTTVTPVTASVQAPRTTAELNGLADGPLPLETKMDVLTKLMREGSSAEAHAAAVRAVYIVKNADFLARLQPLILAAGIKQEAIEVLSLNLYDRPLDLVLPTWALIRDQPGHPLKAAAEDGLAFHLKDKAFAGAADMAQVIKDYLKAH